MLNKAPIRFPLETSVVLFGVLLAKDCIQKWIWNTLAKVVWEKTLTPSNEWGWV